MNTYKLVNAFYRQVNTTFKVSLLTDQFKKIASKPNFCNIKYEYLLQTTQMVAAAI